MDAYQVVKDWRRRNPDKLAEQTRRRQERVRRRNVEKMLKYLEDKQCVDCGERDPLVLQFDHVNGDKRFNIGVYLYRASWHWQKVLVEIEKCVIRCANCHRRKTAEENRSWRWEFSQKSAV